MPGQRSNQQSQPPVAGGLEAPDAHAGDGLPEAPDAAAAEASAALEDYGALEDSGEPAPREASAAAVASGLDEEGDGEDGGFADEGGLEAPPAELVPALVESLLFVSDGPVEPRALGRALGVSSRGIRRALDELRGRLEGRGVRLQSGPDGVQLVSAPEAAPYVEAFLGLEQNRRLSNAALETLAIIAYRQPVTRATVEAIRGVSSDGAIQTLRARGLIEEVGRAQGPGRPTLFATTQRFLEHFGLESPQDLPALDDYDLPPPDAPRPLPGLDTLAAGATEALADAPAETPGADAVEQAEHEVAGDLAALAAAARTLSEPASNRPGATAALLPPASARLELPAAGPAAAMPPAAPPPPPAQPRPELPST